MADVEWTTESAIRLMEEYRQRPELWDTANELYRVQTAKYEAWSDLARVFQCDIADLRKKLNSIFASHRREKAKIRSGGRSTWFLYPYMRFLPNHLENDKHTEVITATKNDEAQSQSEESEQSSDNDDDDEEDNNDNRQVTGVTIKEEPAAESYVKDNRKTIKRTRVNNSLPRPTRPLLKRRIVKERDNSSTTRLDNRLLETLKLLRKSDLSKKKDECDSFGEYIAISLRKHDERTQSMIKQAINNILFEQEMKKYSTGQYTVVISGIDENPLVIGDDK
ncbi:unnamed protein product [Arctia plantaginis]|uniref:MADF domain-containing protein n=1 Tax=Arctia plantaginis TaxID=874455 RepID=A0A8S0ZAZ1_ARCPL|nr:unnamed protein product [Arctia plantaginis]